MLLARLRFADLLLGAAFLLMAGALESRTRVDLGVVHAHEGTEPALITCPLRKADFATVMQAAVLGDGALLVEQQTSTKVRHIKDC